jgi:hypothetical protein
VRLALATLVVAGCSSGYQIAVDATPDRLSIVVRDDSCGATRPPAFGQCVVASDVGGPSCVSHEVSCVTSVRLERGGQVVDEVAVDPSHPPSFETMPSGTDAVVVGCGGEARIPIPMLPAPPQITAWSGGRVEWTESAPVVAFAIQVGNIHCSVDPALAAFDVGQSGGMVSVTASLAETTVDTPIGEARVHASATATALDN